MSNVNVEELVEVYLAIRTAREALAAEYDAQDKALKADLSGVETLMLGVCNEVNADSIKTRHGTVMRSLKERAVCSDWDNFKVFLQDNDLIDLLERRIHQGNFKEFMKDHESDGLPPGVNVMREFGITVRKASK
jgi:predicted protein tyrosine phosphatase